jgi:hypothetical protein
MATLFGEKTRFAAEVGEFSQGTSELRRVDLWAAGKWWTCVDNTAYLPQFCADVQDTLDWIRSGRDLTQPFPELSAIDAHRRLLNLDDGSRERFSFPIWGPTTDNIVAHIFRIEDRSIIPFEFWWTNHPKPEELGIAFAAELPEVEFVDVLQQLLDVLREDAASGGPVRDCE